MVRERARRRQCLASKSTRRAFDLGIDWPITAGKGGTPSAGENDIEGFTLLQNIISYNDCIVNTYSESVEGQIAKHVYETASFMRYKEC